ncbi:MAG: hypothetical protein ACRERV_00780 [Methylococcales bacterium]
MKIRSAIRLIAGNLAVFAGLILSLLLLLSLIGDSYNIAKSFFPKNDKRADLPSYQDHEKARRIYHDQKISNSIYVPFTEWRQPKYASANLNIDENGYRIHTLGTANDANAHSLGFFGGSTVWGTGVDDNGTLPGQFDAITTHYNVTNYGERGYTSLQNLIDLMKLMNQNEAPQTAIFLEGFNDVWVHCNEVVTHSLNGHLEEKHIQTALNRTEKKNYLFNNIISPIMSILLELIGGDEDSQSASCSGSPTRAEAVAELIVRNMEMGHALVSSYGGRFYAFLQPHAYVGSPRIDQLDLAKPDRLIQRQQFEAVYPIVQEKMKTRGLGWFFDISNVINGTQYLLVDHAHVTTEGNRIIAEAIKQKIGDL